MPILATAERVVKCPTGHCPGWITVDDARPQTVPCRYCRVTVNTLSYLLASTPDPAGLAGHTGTRLPPAVHEAFNSLVLRVAGMTGGNVYLRPMDRTLVSLVPSTRGVIVEYNPVIARQAGPAAVVALILHHLLHIDQHPRQEKALGIALRPGARDRDSLQPAANYLLSLADHAWIAPRIAAIDRALPAAAQAWGLPVAEMTTGTETFFPPYMAERNRRWTMEQLDAPDASGPALTAALVDRLASLSARFFAGQREELRRALVALQLADLSFRHPDQIGPYQEALAAAGLANVETAATMGGHLTQELSEIVAGTPTFDPVAYRRALEAGLKALGLQTAFEVQALKSA